VSDLRVKQDAYPSPTEFKHDEAFKKTIKKDLMVKMGKAKREVDFTKCKVYSTLNKLSFTCSLELLLLKKQRY
jgi:hypothetical protein